MRALGLLGDRLLDFSPGTPNREPLRTADTLDVESFAELGDLFAAADTALRAVTAVSGDLRLVTAQLRNGNGTVGKLFTDHALYDTLLQTVRRADAVLTQMQVGRGTLGRLLRDTTLYGSMTSAALALDSAASLINDRDGMLARLQRDTTLYVRLRRASIGVDSLVRGLNAGRGTAGQPLTIRVTDLLGRPVFSRYLLPDAYLTDVPLRLPTTTTPGTYLVTATTGPNTWTMRWTLQP